MRKTSKAISRQSTEKSTGKTRWFAVIALLLASAAVAAITFARVATLGVSTPSFTNVQVNQVFSGPFVPNRQNEPSLAQNPLNPSNLIAGANDDIGEPDCTNAPPSVCSEPSGIQSTGFYASFDGGATWPCQGLIDVSAFGEYSIGDPGQTFDSKGNAYFSTLAVPTSGTASAGQTATGLQADVFVAKSPASTSTPRVAGCSYGTSARVSGKSLAIMDDKPSIAADANSSSPFHDNVYVGWVTFVLSTTQHVQIVFSRSTDGGATWSNPLALSPAFPQLVLAGVPARETPVVKVGPDGTVYVVWVAAGNPLLLPAAKPVLQMAISRDGGLTFPGPKITVATIEDDFINPLPGSSFLSAGRLFPSLAIVPDGTLYVAWCEHHLTSPTTGHGIVKVTKSTTGGRTWSTPVVAGDVSGRSAFFSSVAADPSGNVDVAFLALDDVPTGTAPGAGVVHYDAYFTQLTNVGTSFSTPIPISTATSDPDGSSTLDLTAQDLGDYITAVADPGGHKLFAVWTDSRNATTCDAVDDFRAGETTVAPDIIASCAPTFGNTDIFLGTVSY